VTAPAPCVLAVCLDRRHAFSKPPAEVIRLRAGWGVEGDAHAGTAVQHRSRKRWNPTLPNLRQVHLLQAELHEELSAAGYPVRPGDLGENVTTRGLDLLGLPVGTVLRLGPDAAVQITGLRNPCVQIDRFAQGLLALNLDRDADGNVVRKTGVMAVVLSDGEVRPGDVIRVELPAEPHRRLAPV
jgi:MOSC domain-containing protein YiiM